MKQNKIVAALTKERTWLWFFPGTLTVLGGGLLIAGALGPAVSVKEIRAGAALRRARFEFEQASSLSNQIATAQREYDKSADRHWAAGQVVLDAALAEATLKRLNGATSHMVIPDFTRVTRLEGEERRQRAEDSRASLARMAGEAARLISARSGQIEELERLHAAEKRRSWWSQVTSILFGISVLGGGLIGLVRAKAHAAGHP